ncbi:MAG TPA: hypothetical protein DG048_03905 [Pseudoalteromonas sp.]|nr:hypothetical protein [Pseudoalteromonas sp.]
MSSQRKEGKQLVSSYVWSKDKEKLQQFAKEHGLTMSDVIKAMVSELDTLEKKALKKIVDAAKHSEDN